MFNLRLKRLLLRVIRAYQKLVSPFLRSRCRFTPSCSEYSFLAVKKYGALKGMLLSFWRILRCNPFSKGGVDLP